MFLPSWGSETKYFSAVSWGELLNSTTLSAFLEILRSRESRQTVSVYISLCKPAGLAGLFSCLSRLGRGTGLLDYTFGFYPVDRV